MQSITTISFGDQLTHIPQTAAWQQAGMSKSMSRMAIDGSSDCTKSNLGRRFEALVPAPTDGGATEPNLVDIAKKLDMIVGFHRDIQSCIDNVYSELGAGLCLV